MRRMDHPPRPRRRALFAALLAFLALAFAALGAWQIERRAGKLALIDAVNRRATVAAAPAPDPGAWSVTAADDAYRHVRAEGVWLNDRETLVQAVTDFGAGSWVITPLRTPAGWTVLVNRGFVPADHADPALHRPASARGASVTGLLRITEPGGGFLRTNDRAGNRWYSRDVAAIAEARGLGETAPYFIDADATPNPGGFPIGGLTLIAFPNNHLVYAITWFSLCGLSLFGVVQVLRQAPE